MTQVFAVLEKDQHKVRLLSDTTGASLGDRKINVVACTGDKRPTCKQCNESILHDPFLGVEYSYDPKRHIPICLACGRERKWIADRIVQLATAAHKKLCACGHLHRQPELQCDSCSCEKHTEEHKRTTLQLVVKSKPREHRPDYLRSPANYVRSADMPEDPHELHDICECGHAHDNPGKFQKRCPATGCGCLYFKFPSRPDKKPVTLRPTKSIKPRIKLVDPDEE